MSDVTTAYLENGQYVEVLEETVREWRGEVIAGATDMGLAQWYCTDPATGDRLEDVDVLGSAEDAVRCSHPDADIYVTNEAQTEGYQAAEPHAAVWVCARDECVLDAMAWVQRITCDRPYYSHNQRRSWVCLQPTRC